MAKQPRNTGWIRNRDAAKVGNLQECPIGPTAFEKMIEQLGVPITEATKHPIVILWVRANFCRRYVPEKILDALGLRLSERQLGMDVTRERGQQVSAHSGVSPS
jgi:hypothetical protein